MATDMRQLGLENKRKAMHQSGSTIWTYAEGHLSQNVNGLISTLSAVDTLALANVLYSHYDEIVQFARKEQRKTEELNPKSAYHYGTYARKKKPS